MVEYLLAGVLLVMIMIYGWCKEYDGFELGKKTGYLFTIQKLQEAMIIDVNENGYVVVHPVSLLECIDKLEQAGYIEIVDDRLKKTSE